MDADVLYGAVEPFDLDLASKAGRERVALAINVLNIAFFEADLRTGRTVVTPNLFDMFGLDQSKSPERRMFWDCYHPDDKEWAQARYNADLNGERGTDIYRESVRIIRQNDGEIRHIEWTGRMFGPPGARTHTIGMARDITDHVEAERARSLLTREVHHRANNALQVVQSLIKLTTGPDIASYKETLMRRVMSLARTNSLRFASGEAVHLEKLIRQEMSAYEGHVTLDLHNLILKGGGAQPVAMILHELATNAAKHGALSQDGQVHIGVCLDEDDVVLRWSESGGPVIKPPLHKGTGMAVINQQSRALGGSLSQKWPSSGLTLELRFSGKSWIEPNALDVNSLPD